MLTAENKSYHALIPSLELTAEYTITLQTYTSHKHAIEFTAKLDTFQVNQVNREIDNWTATYMYPHLVPSKLVAACNICVQLFGCALTVWAKPSIYTIIVWEA